MKLTFAIEPLVPVWDEIVSNGWRHWQETEMHKCGEPFEPSYERYTQYGDSYVLFTVRNEAGEMVGNCGMYVMPSMHNQRLLAVEDAWYLWPEYRKGRVAIDLHKFVVAEMRRRGVTKVTMTAAPYNGACRIMEYLGYTLDCYKYSLDLTVKPELSSVTGADSAVMDLPTLTENADVLTESAPRT